MAPVELILLVLLCHLEPNPPFFFIGRHWISPRTCAYRTRAGGQPTRVRSVEFPKLFTRLTDVQNVEWPSSSSDHAQRDGGDLATEVKTDRLQHMFANSTRKRVSPIATLFHEVFYE